MDFFHFETIFGHIDPILEPLSWSQIRVYNYGSDQLSQLFEDAGLTIKDSNPIQADKMGNFKLLYLLDGLYRFELHSANGEIIAIADNLFIGASRPNRIPNFETVAALLADRFLNYSSNITPFFVQPGSIIQVGTGTFVYQVASQSASDAHLTTAGGVGLYVQPNANSQLEIKAFGAVGDGSTIDTNAFKRAFNSIKSGQVLSIGVGTYMLDASISLNGIDNLYIRSEGGVLKEVGSETIALLYFESCDNLVLDGLTFIGTEDEAYFQTNTPTEIRSFVKIYNCHSPRLSHLKGNGKRRLMYIEDSHRAIVEGFSFTGFFGAVTTTVVANAKEHVALAVRRCNNSRITGGYIENCGSAFHGLHNSRSVSVSSLSCKDIHDAAIYFSSAGDCSCIGCVVDSVGTDGIKMRANILGGTISGNTITRAGIYGLGYGIVATGAGTLLATPPKNYGANGGIVVISGNTIRDSAGGIRVSTADGFCPRDITITGNVIDNISMTGDIGAIRIWSNVGGMNVSNNQIRNVAADNGVSIEGVDGVLEGLVFTGNHINGVNGSGAASRGGVRISDVNNATVSSNIFANIASNIGINLRSGTNGVISGNCYEGGRVVQTDTGGLTSGWCISGNTGGTLLTTTSNFLGVNAAHVIGFPDPTVDTPMAVGQITVADSKAYIATGLVSVDNWTQIG